GAEQLDEVVVLADRRADLQDRDAAANRGELPQAPGDLAHQAALDRGRRELPAAREFQIVVEVVRQRAVIDLVSVKDLAVRGAEQRGGLGLDGDRRPGRCGIPVRAGVPRRPKLVPGVAADLVRHGFSVAYGSGESPEPDAGAPAPDRVSCWTL